MGKLFDGIFYKYYWNNHVSNSASESLLLAISLVSIFAAPIIGTLFLVFARYLNTEYQDSCLKICVFSPLLIFAIYYLIGKRYKRIIRQHKLYKTRKYKICAVLYPVITIGQMFIALAIDFIITQ